MNLRKMRTAFAGLLMIGMVFTACKGEDGDAGADGNANVISNSTTIDGTEWNAGQLELDIPQLSKGIVENGSVAVYFTADSLGADTTTWNPLPFRFVGNVGGVNTFITLDYTFSIGSVVISATTSQNQGVNFTQPATYRVVLIPSSAKVEGVNLDNYDEVKAVYGIKEEVIEF